MDSISIALSGLTAQKLRLAASASNIANVSTGGAVPSDDPSVPASSVYRPLRADLSPIVVDGAGVGVQGEIREIENPYSLSYDPSSIYANKEGYIAVPNIDLATEAVNILLAKTAFKANLAVIRTQEEMAGELLDTLA